MQPLNSEHFECIPDQCSAHSVIWESLLLQADRGLQNKEIINVQPSSDFKVTFICLNRKEQDSDFAPSWCVCACILKKLVHKYCRLSEYASYDPFAQSTTAWFPLLQYLHYYRSWLSMVIKFCRQNMKFKSGYYCGIWQIKKLAQITFPLLQELVMGAVAMTSHG